MYLGEQGRPDGLNFLYVCGLQDRLQLIGLKTR